VIDAYPDDTMGHPVGTGAYRLKSWTRRSKIVLEANPEFRGFVWDFQPNDDPWDKALYATMKGRRMPQVGRVEITIIEEAQSRWLAFQQKEIDYMNVPETFAPNVLDGDKLKPELAKEGILLYRVADPDLTYTAFNMRDPVIGGFAKDKIALRRAMAMAYNVDEQIRVVRKGQAMHMQMPIPPGVVGHDPHYRSIIQYDPDTANKLLDYFGYKKGADGWRTLPDGKPLVLQLASQPSSSSRELDEVWHKALSSIGIKMEGSASRRSSTTSRRPKPASFRCGARPGSPIIPTATTSCSSCMGRTRDRATTAATNRRRSTASMKSRGSCRTPPSATGCSSK
jgi:ABC-type transport system substrate-binding protein